MVTKKEFCDRKFMHNVVTVWKQVTDSYELDLITE